MRTKKVLSVFLACFLVLAMLPLSAFAEDGEACVHANVTETVLKAATCTATGIKKTVCNDCGETLYYQLPVSHTAPEDGAEIKEPTCGEAGEKRYVCVVCGADAIDVIPATGKHEFGENVKDATCTEPAKAGIICAVCGMEDPENPATEVGEPMGHSYESEITSAATCTEAGVTTYTCTACGDSYTEAIPALGHTVGESVVLDADCENNEREAVLCAVCGEVLETNDLSEVGGALAKGHSFGSWIYEEVTEGEGEEAEVKHTHYRVCSACGKKETAYCTFTESVTDATCSSYKIITYSCADCSMSYSVEDIEAGYDTSVHTYIKQTIKAATCTVNGIAKNVCACGASGGYEVIPASHSWELREVITAASCLESGEGKYVCAVCGDEKTEVLAATGHSYNAEVTKEANCGFEGVMTYTCACGDTYTEEIPSAGEHSYEETVVDATCTEPAMVGMFCAVCGQADPSCEIAYVGEALGHSFASEVTTEATCTSDGIMTYTCVCGESYTEVIPATGHKNGESAVLAADCENNEREVVYCANCGEIIETNDLTDVGGAQATGHSYGEWVYEEVVEGEGEETVIKHTHLRICSSCNKTEHENCSFEAAVTSATCSSYEKTVYTCTSCGFAYEVENSDKGFDNTVHSYEAKTIKEPTCAVNGIMKYVCSCGAANGYEVIPASHEWVESEVITAATCLEAGESKFICSVCGDEKNDTVAAKGHSYEAAVTTEGNCGTAGVMTYTCVCGDTYTEEIPATGSHSYAETVVDATCTEPAMVGMFCAVCGQADPSAEIAYVGEALGHSFASEVTTEATCTSDGIMTYTCVCGESYTEVIPATGHKNGESAVLAADCENNEREVVYCANCGEIIETNDLTDVGGAAATGHSYSEWAYEEVIEGEGDEAVTKHTHIRVCSVCGKVEREDCAFDAAVTSATCSSYEKTAYTCTSCGFTYEVENSDKGYDSTVHSYEAKTIKGATCTVNGIAKLVCSCGAANGYEVIPAFHSWTVSEIIKAATCLEAGESKFVCTVCGGEKTEEVAATGHSYSSEVTKEANCGVAGVMTYTCVCGDSYTEDIPATGSHSYAETVVDATCTEAARVGMFCSVCGGENPEEPAVSVGEALGHNYEGEITTAPTCVEDGVITFTCSACGDSYTEAVEALGHKAGESAILAADCENNEREVVYCASCGEIIESNDLTEYGGAVATGHSFGEFTYEAVTEGEGEEAVTRHTHVRVCSVCGKVEREDCAFEAEVISASCSTYETTVYTCSCKFSYSVETGSEYNADNHIYVAAVVKAATCTKNGIGKMICACGDVDHYYVIEASEHSWNDVVVTTAPTCSAEGAGTRTCSVCGETEDVTVPVIAHVWSEDYANSAGTAVLHQCTVCGTIETVWTADGYVDCSEGHTVVTVEGKAATCTEDGLTAGEKCSNCGMVIKAQEVIPAVGHSYEETNAWIEDGVAYVEYTCASCGDKYTENSEN